MGETRRESTERLGEPAGLQQAEQQGNQCQPTDEPDQEEATDERHQSTDQAAQGDAEQFSAAESEL
ncbi:MAG: hypothetical protein V5A38_12720 [Halolamina sp.]|uniref:hypothetical protein n=1 Tax=Halolamina sp. TaxID=1940283 RepID=UPI002FC31223